MSKSRFDGTSRLAKRVLDGEVVFFVGSGFSIDSEGNDANRLVGRLLAGLLAMGTILAEESGLDPAPSSLLLDGLGRVFGLAGAEQPGDASRKPAQCMIDANLKLLARDYFNFNDWAVSALGVLSGELLDLAEPRCGAVAGRMQQLGTFLLGLVGDKDPLDAIDCRALRGFATDAARGKALFLDMMGFANERIMAGTPREGDVKQVARSYRGRLRPRHHALARLAREGLAPALVTTNYDLLLEGAYRLAGFVERENIDPEADGTLAETLPRFSRIAGADQFFARGQGYRTALLLKIHGCAQAYRDARGERLKVLADAQGVGAEPDVWAAYLPALVFTYREIQTWRADAWSRDLIRTLLRTHTIALCGYSAADPVMHSTFREVYEEKAGSRGVAAATSEDAGAENASVFFFGLAGRREFHSLEILRAATVAAGFRTGKLVEHPNHIEFERANGFPTLDDHFRWLTHCILRELQMETLVSGLRRLAPRLLQRFSRDKELEEIRERFAAIYCAEKDAVAAASAADAATPVAARLRTFEAVVGWTWHFVPGFLSELALAEVVENSQGAGHAVRTRRTWAYYHPASEHLEWTAWAVVVELALRSLVAVLARNPSVAAAHLVAEESPYAAISFDSGDAPPHPFALCIRLAGFERMGRAPPLTGVFRHVTFWEFAEQDVPWPLQPTGACPSPNQIWRWAVGKTPPSPDEVARHLEGKL
jgi:hypothetical protein